MLLASAAAAQANMIQVTTTGDPSGPGDCLDAGQCSLRQAVTAASSGDTIELGSGTYSLTQGADIEISKSLVVQGASVSGTTIDGSQNSDSADALHRIFRTDAGATVTIQDLTLTGGDDEADEQPCNACATVSLNGGGALWNDGAAVVVNRVAFADNPGGPLGGGVSISGGTLTMTDVSFTDDQQRRSAAPCSSTAARSSVTASRSRTTGTGCCDISAVYLYGGPTASFTNTTVVGSCRGPSSIGGAHPQRRRDADPRRTTPCRTTCGAR